MAYGGVMGVAFIKPILMHDPIRLLPMRSSSLVKHKRLSQPNSSKAAVDDLVPACGLPKPGSRCPIGSSSGRVLLVFVTEKVPIVLWGGTYLALLCIMSEKLINKPTTMNCDCVYMN